jgi:hypothetical protein
MEAPSASPPQAISAWAADAHLTKKRGGTHHQQKHHAQFHERANSQSYARGCKSLFKSQTVEAD